MICDICKCEMRITGKKLVFEGDSSPDTETKAFMDLTFECKNPKCTNKNPITVRHPFEG